MRYTHKHGQCYQIQEYIVWDYEVTIRTGTLCYYLNVNTEALLRSRQFAMRFLWDRTLNALASYYDPTTGVAGGLADIGVIVSGASLPPIFSDIAQGISMGQLLDNIQDITDRVETRLNEIDRLLALDGTELFCFEDVKWRRRYQTVKTYSSVEIVEVECTDWILEIPEGETLHIPEQTERIYPLPELDQEDTGRFKSLRNAYSTDKRNAGIGFLKDVIKKQEIQKTDTDKKR
ncbi:hypothetical protein LQ318_03880 [Aliifodinibius salicampi]|uniref:Uncharacterized protein n=1 Tax=Fodinibius salicampi TaxID=1920655 RepID=A0ABT3PW54_9BACT|nr:hypothetical protein [Fodinibius salicampi]MCW9712036.1 hypothetical protein [Fodinibius salicampi]